MAVTIKKKSGESSDAPTLNEILLALPLDTRRELENRLRGSRQTKQIARELAEEHLKDFKFDYIYNALKKLRLKVVKGKAPLTQETQAHHSLNIVARAGLDPDNYIKPEAIRLEELIAVTESVVGRLVEREALAKNDKRNPHTSDLFKAIALEGRLLAQSFDMKTRQGLNTVYTAKERRAIQAQYAQQKSIGMNSGEGLPAEIHKAPESDKIRLTTLYHDLLDQGKSQETINIAIKEYAKTLREARDIRTNGRANYDA